MFIALDSNIIQLDVFINMLIMLQKSRMSKTKTNPDFRKQLSTQFWTRYTIICDCVTEQVV